MCVLRPRVKVFSHVTGVSWRTLWWAAAGLRLHLPLGHAQWCHQMECDEDWHTVISDGLAQWRVGPCDGNAVMSSQGWIVWCYATLRCYVTLCVCFRFSWLSVSIWVWVETDWAAVNLTHWDQTFVLSTQVCWTTSLQLALSEYNNTTHTVCVTLSDIIVCVF